MGGRYSTLVPFSDTINGSVHRTFSLTTGHVLVVTYMSCRHPAHDHGLGSRTRIRPWRTSRRVLGRLGPGR
jgi:hypothetical protein